MKNLGGKYSSSVKYIKQINFWHEKITNMEQSGGKNAEKVGE